MDKNKKIGLVSLIMMIFSSIFGFANMPVAFLQMAMQVLFGIFLQPSSSSCQLL